MRISDWSSDVCSSDLRDLVSAWPVFQPLLTPDGGIHVRQRLVPDQAVNAVSRAEAGRLFAVYVEPPDQVGGDADIERAGAFRGEDVDAGAEFARHPYAMESAGSFPALGVPPSPPNRHPGESARADGSGPHEAQGASGAPVTSEECKAEDEVCAGRAG